MKVPVKSGHSVCRREEAEESWGKGCVGVDGVGRKERARKGAEGKEGGKRRAWEGR